MQDEKLALQLQCNDQQNDIQSLRKELLQAEQTRLDLEADKQTFAEKARFLEIEKEKVNILFPINLVRKFIDVLTTE